MAILLPYDIQMQIATCILSARDLFYIMEGHSSTAVKINISPLYHLPFWRSILRTHPELSSLSLQRSTYSAWFGLSFGVLVLLASLFWIFLNILGINPDTSHKSSSTATKSKAEMSWVIHSHRASAQSRRGSTDPRWAPDILGVEHCEGKACAPYWGKMTALH